MPDQKHCNCETQPQACLASCPNPLCELQTIFLVMFCQCVTFIFIKVKIDIKKHHNHFAEMMPNRLTLCLVRAKKWKSTLSPTFIRLMVSLALTLGRRRSWECQLDWPVSIAKDTSLTGGSMEPILGKADAGQRLQQRKQRIQSCFMPTIPRPWCRRRPSLMARWPRRAWSGRWAAAAEGAPQKQPRLLQVSTDQADQINQIL